MLSSFANEHSGDPVIAECLVGSEGRRDRRDQVWNRMKVHHATTRYAITCWVDDSKEQDP